MPNVIAIPALVLVLGLSVVAFIKWRRARRYREMRRAERIRSTFAEARGALVMKAVRGEVLADSVSYRVLYGLQTAIMRQSDEYANLWHGLIDSINKSTKARKAGLSSPLNAAMERERETWDAEMRAIVEKTCGGINAILFEYSVLLRVLAPIMRWRAQRREARREQARSHIESRVEAFETRKNPVRTDVRAFISTLAGSGGGGPNCVA